MPTKPCAEPAGSQIIAQTLFLGASVGSFNTSMGWGGQPSQLTVTLIEDSASDKCLIGTLPQDANIAAQFPLSAGEDGTLKQASDTDRFSLDHYHLCSGDSCYVNSKGTAFDSATMDVSERMVPGKVYYEFFSQNTTVSANSPDIINLNKCVKSKYWYNPDPGFFGQPNRINIDNTYNSTWKIDNSNLNKGYDIIDTPVFFKMGNFTFGGLVQSWDRQVGQGGKTYTVTINSIQSLLNSCYVIVDGYAGSIYSKLQGSTPATTLANNSLYGGPRNYTGFAGVDYFGKIYEGNIPNVFNVYGFLESFGKDGFGGANINSEGLSANAIIDSLSVLTGAIDLASAPNGSTNSRLLTYHNTSNTFKDYGPRSAFSPFGRILAKCMQENDTYLPISPLFKRFGVIPPSTVAQDLSSAPKDRCQFVLDLSEVPRLPNDFRITGPVLTITDILNRISEHAGFDYYVDLVPLSFGNKFYNVIKVKTISRLAQPRTNIIENTIKNLQCNGYAISSTTIGKEKNETSARAIVFGGSVQRLYQAKSLRLAYTQSNYIFDPISGDFIDYMSLGTFGAIDGDFNTGARAPAAGATKQFHYGKTRVPSVLDLHNPNLSSLINPTYKGIYTHNDEIKQRTGSFLFSEKDTNWNDKDQLGTQLADKESGNYFKASILKQEISDTATWGTRPTDRWFPLWKDVICPFFGFVKDNQLDVKIDGKNNDFRRVRPVWFDTWTGQTVVMVQVNELPETSVYLKGMFDTTRTVSDVVGQNRTITTSYFLLTESEIRAALAGFDEFIVYCLSKTYTNDLIEMLRRAHILKDAAKYYDELQQNEVLALKKAQEKHNWFWRLINNNINMPMGNIAGAFRQPIAPPAPAQAQGTYRIPQNVLKDLQILHSFVSDIAKNYGQKYMVVAPYLATYKENTYSRIALPTSAGTAFVFSGGGELKYSYNPTQDGAWEEYGNIIDDCIAVGSKEWYNLTDDVGKTVPILGYNANDSLDLIKFAACQMTQERFDKFSNGGSLSPFWSFNAWDTMKDVRDNTCLEGKYSFPSLDYSKLNSSDYVLVSVSGINGQLPAIVDQRSLDTWTPSQFTLPTYGWAASIARDAFGRQIFGVPPISGLPSSQATPTNVPSPVKKLFVKASVNENFIFLDPENLQEPRILIDSPGITLNPITQETASDPSSTILANAVIEDVTIYVRSTIQSGRDYNWINYMMSHIYTIIGNSVNSYITGSLASSANKSAAYARMAPKAAHPFFAGIPLKSNAHNYGPWTNYPYLEYLNEPESVFPSGVSITTSDSLPPVCSTGVAIVDDAAAKRAVDNWILPTLVTREEGYVPWNYGGMAYLDNVAHNYVRSITNYQNVIEKAQIDIPGLPLFNLGGSFSYGSFAFIPSGVKCTGLKFQDVKYNLSNPIIPLPDNLPILYSPLINTTGIDNIEYQVLQVVSDINYGNPVITNIQTSVSQGGITTTYSFRTYTRKLGFFNKEYSDNIKRSNLDRIRRNKQLIDAINQTTNSISKQQNAMSLNRFANNSDVNVRSKLFGWSPVKVLIGQSAPYLEMPYFESPHTGIAMNSYIRQRLSQQAPQHNIIYGSDPGHDAKTLDTNNSSPTYKSSIYLTDTSAVAKLSENMRHRTDVALFEEKEAIAQIQQDYGLQGMMSLDGIFSPVSFYPTFKNSTYHFTLYDTNSCPFCSGTKRINVTYQAPLANGYSPITIIDIYCDKCKSPDEKLNFSLKSNITSKSSSRSIETLPPYIVTSGTDLSALLEYGIDKKQSLSIQSSSSSSSAGSAGQNIPINMVSLQPIVVPYGEFRNSNTQSYSGIHPEGIHDNLSIGAYSSAFPRTFYDRCRHSIEIVGRGSIVPADLYTGTSLTNASGLKYFDNNAISPNRLIVNTDYYEKDINLQKSIRDRGSNAPLILNNQRFLGLRGPLVLHAWGYDLEGYPIPNAADEPYEFDTHGRPRRFLIKNKDGFPKTVKFKDLKIGDTYKYNNIEYVKDKILSDTESIAIGTSTINNSTDVSQTAYEDDMSDEGGFDPGASQTLGDRTTGYRGSIISKTQKWDGSQWSAKKKLKEFYLNWAERPDIWPVGPIDLRWDSDRKVWATKSDASIYKMVYITLEEDLVKEDDYDETYPARAFLDDVEYSNQPLPDGFRRLVFVKDRGGYTAPRGAKLLCRYSADTGFYEPISKQTFVVGGLLSGSSTATIQLSYIAGRKKGEPVPTMLVNFSNPFEFNTIIGNRGLFTFMNGQWTLTATKEV